VPISYDDTPLLQGPVRIFSRCCARTLLFRSRLYDLSSPEDLGWRARARDLLHHGMMEMKILQRYRDRAGTRVRRRWRPGKGLERARRRSLNRISAASERFAKPVLLLEMAARRSEKLGFQVVEPYRRYLGRDIMKGHGRPFSTPARSLSFAFGTALPAPEPSLVRA
jgi:hypothetical protein